MRPPVGRREVEQMMLGFDVLHHVEMVDCAKNLINVSELVNVPCVQVTDDRWPRGLIEPRRFLDAEAQVRPTAIPCLRAWR